MDAPAPHGRRGYGADAAAGDGWGPATSVRSSFAPPVPNPSTQAPPSPVQRRPAPSPAGPPVGIAEADSAERGLPAWLALVVLLGIAGVGGLIDTVSGAQVRGGFNIGVIVASTIAILAVKRSAMFPIVVAPPLVYSGASAVMLYLRSGGLHDRRVLFDGAANWLVYGFPAIAAATASVLIIAGIRLIAHR